MHTSAKFKGRATAFTERNSRIAQKATALGTFSRRPQWPSRKSRTNRKNGLLKQTGKDLALTPRSTPWNHRRLVSGADVQTRNPDTLQSPATQHGRTGSRDEEAIWWLEERPNVRFRRQIVHEARIWKKNWQPLQLKALTAKSLTWIFRLGVDASGIWVTF